MAMFSAVRNINPLGDVSVVVDGNRVDVPAGGVVKVSPEEAGTAPRWRRVEVDDSDHPLEELGGRETREHAGHLEVHDLGSGLLAQTSNWEPATKAEAPEDDETPPTVAEGEPAIQTEAVTSVAATENPQEG